MELEEFERELWSLVGKAFLLGYLAATAINVVTVVIAILLWSGRHGS